MCVEKERLDRCQAKLLARGYKDVKFFYGNVGGKALSETATEAADVLEAILDDYTSEFTPFNESAGN